MAVVSRREFLESALGVPAGLALQRQPALAKRFSDLKRHFAFEYYPWYRTDPWEHWTEGGHRPPADFGSNFVPALGLYDSRSTAVMEQHARWIAEAGVGAIDVSWWGPESNVNQVIPTLMDVMKAHDIHVAFNVEPYADAHATNYASDLLYLIKNYGDRRRWDCLLLHQDEGGKVGPIFKAFRTILPDKAIDCHGVTTPVADYAADDVWRVAHLGHATADVVDLHVPDSRLQDDDHSDLPSTWANGRSSAISLANLSGFKDCRGRNLNAHAILECDVSLDSSNDFLHRTFGHDLSKVQDHHIITYAFNLC